MNKKIIAFIFTVTFSALGLFGGWIGQGISPAMAAGSEKTTAQFTIGQKSYIKDGETVSIDVAPYFKNGRTMIPF